MDEELKEGIKQPLEPETDKVAEKIKEVPDPVDPVELKKEPVFEIPQTTRFDFLLYVASLKPEELLNPKAALTALVKRAGQLTK